MATAKEVGLKLESKRGELAEFLKARQTPQGLDFQGDDQTIFVDRNSELKELGEQHRQLLENERLAQENEAELKGMQKVVRHPIYDGLTQTSQDQGAFKTLGELFMESDEYKMHSDKSPSANGVWKAEIVGASVANNLKAALSTTTGTTPYPVSRAVVTYATRRPVMRELLPLQDTDGYQQIRIIREDAPVYGTDIVPEGGLKPETSLSTTPANITLEVIAHHIKVTDQALRFIPGVQNLIDNRGTTGIMLKEEDVMLNYSGAAGWKGFLQQTGVQTSALGAQDQFTAFHQGMNQVQYTGFANVTGAVMHNNDWHKLVTLKDLNGRFIYGDPAQALTNRNVWGVPVIVTPVITEGLVLAGDFVQDSRWWVAGGIIVKVGYVGDDMTRNQQTIVVEEYGALEISRPASFVKMTGWDAIPA